MRLQRLFKIIFPFGIIFFCLIFSGCSSTRWNAAHPKYNQAPQKNEKISLIGFRDAFVLTRDAFFSKRLGIQRENVFSVIENLTDSVFENSLKNHFSHLTLFPDSLKKTFLEETQKLSEHTFLKIRIPEQGVILQTDSDKPQFVLIIHDFIFGTDLIRDNYFNYTLAHQETETKRSVENLSLIMTYTLWDNLKQRALFSSAIEIQQKISGEPQIENFIKATEDAVKIMISELEKGVIP